VDAKRHYFNLRLFRCKRLRVKSYNLVNCLYKAIALGVISCCALIGLSAAPVNSTEKVVIDTQAEIVDIKQQTEKVEINPQTDTIPEKLDEIIIIAFKDSLPLKLSAKMVNIILPKQIELAPVKSLQDLLCYFSGVDVLQRGPHGVQADITLRGGSFDQTAILLNGVNLTNPQTGHYSLDIPLNLSDIERIEIVQGPSSLIFGASAFSGGINIITKKDTQTNAFAKLEGGMHALFNAEVRGALRAKSSVHSLSAGYKRSDGYIANSDYKIMNFLWQSSFNIEGSHIDIQAGVNDKKYGANTFYAAAFPNQYDDTQGLFFSIKGETNGKIKFIPQLYWSRHYDEFHLFRPGTPEIPSWYKAPNYHQTDVYGVNLNIQYISKLGITRFGGEFRNEGVLSSNLGKPMRQPRDNYNLWDNRSDISFFAEHNFVIDKLTLSLGALYNYNTALADTLKAGGFYPAINFSYRPTNSITLYTSWSKAMRMPTFTDLYYKAGKHRGFAGLAPEYTQSVELGMRFSRPVVAANLNAFYTEGDNMIDWIFNTTDSLYHAENRSALSTFGVSVDASINLSRWMGERQPFEQLRFGYQYISQKSDNESQGNPISAYVSNYLRHKFTLSVEHRIIKNLTFSWNMRYQERAGNYLKFIPATATEKAHEVITPYEPFVLLDLKANYALRNLNIFVNFNNLLNTTHVDFGNIPQPGFWLTGGVSYRFE